MSAAATNPAATRALTTNRNRPRESRSRNSRIRETRPKSPKRPRPTVRIRGAKGRRFWTVRGVTRFKVCSGTERSSSIRARIAVRAASEDPAAKKKSQASHTVANVIATRNENSASRRAVSLGVEPRNRGMNERRANTPRIVRMRMAEVGWETTRPTNRPAEAIRHLVSVRRKVAKTRSARTKPNAWGEAWYWAHTANRAVGTAAARAVAGGNADRRS